MDDFSKMKEMVTRLRKVRQNEAKTTSVNETSSTSGGAGSSNTGSTATSSKGGVPGKSIPARTSIQ